MAGGTLATNHTYSQENKNTLPDRGAKEALRFINSAQLDSAARKASCHLQLKTQAYLLRGEAFSLHPQFVRSRWGTVTRGDNCRRLITNERNT